MDLIPKEKCITNYLLVEKNMILLPPLHIKLGLIKNFVKVLDKHGQGFGYMREKFHKPSGSNIY